MNEEFSSQDLVQTNNNVGVGTDKIAEEHLEENFLNELLENPLRYASEHFLTAGGKDTGEGIAAVKGVDGNAKNVDDHDHHGMNHNSFCNPMMMMDEHSRRLHGVASMSMGGDMSKGMVMYMDGFRFAMAGNQPCLNLYFPSWTLDTRFKFLGCLLLVFVISFGTEGVSKYRHQLSSRRGRQSRRTRQIVISLLHGVQALLGYVVMLATMTFSVEILLSVVLGLSSGYYYYFAGEVGLEGHVTTNPCCNYMQDESYDHEQAQFQQQQQQSANTTGGDTMTTSLLNSPQTTSLDGTNV